MTCANFPATCGRDGTPVTARFLAGDDASIATSFSGFDVPIVRCAAGADVPLRGCSAKVGPGRWRGGVRVLVGAAVFNTGETEDSVWRVRFPSTSAIAGGSRG